MLFLETLQPCGFTDFYGGTWIYEKRLIYYDTQFHIKYAPYTLGEHNNTSIIIRKGGGERKRQHSEKMFFTHKMKFACAAN